MTDKPFSKLPSVTPQISWFEFLLDPTGDVLRNYVKKCKPDPPPWNLCSLFLEKSKYQPGLGTQASVGHGVQIETRRGKQLCYLATALCSYLRWNLEEMVENLTLPMQLTLINELRRSFNIPEASDEVAPDFNSLSPQNVMAWTIYHRWIVKTVCKYRFGDKSRKTDLSGSDGKDMADDLYVTKLQDMLPFTLKTLELIQSTSLEMAIPFPLPVETSALQKPTQNPRVEEPVEQGENAEQDLEENGPNDTSVESNVKENNSSNQKSTIVFAEYNENIPVPVLHVYAQISSEVGMYYFFVGNFDAAYKHFHSLFNTLKTDIAIKEIVPIGKMKGFYRACASVLRLPVSLPEQFTDEDIVSQLEDSLKANAHGIVDVLIEDTILNQIPLRFRTEAENRLHFMNRPDLLMPVCILNCLRSYSENGSVPTDFLSYTSKLNAEELNKLKLHLKKFVLEGDQETLGNEIIGCLVAHKPGRKAVFNAELLQGFFRVFLRFVHPFLRDIFLNDSGLRKYLPENFQKTQGIKRRRFVPPDNQLDGNSFVTFTSTQLFENEVTSPEEKHALLRRQLSVTFDPDKLKGIIEEMRTLFPEKSSIVGFECLDYKENLLEVQDPVLHDLLHVIFTKANHFSEKKVYRKTLSLLSNGLDALNQYVQQINPGVHLAKVKNIIHHELLWSEISWEQTKESTNADTVRRCKACYHHRNQDPWPRKHVFEQMVSFLLNTKEWQFLIDEGGSFERQIDHREIGYHLALLSNGISRAGDYVRRDLSPGLWNAVVRIITEHIIPPLLQQAPSGNIQQQPSWRSPPNLTRSDLVSFAKQIKEEIILSIITSCLASMLNIAMNDPERELNTLYRHIWPTCFDSIKPDPKGEQIVGVLRPIVDHMIKLNPQNISWIRNKADLDFYEGKYVDAMRSYLEIGAITTAFFSTPVHYNVWDDQVYKRLILCCQHEKAYTQVAILCQFLNPIDYTVAFKALKEGTSDDAADALYECFWDITILEFIIYMHNKRGEHDKKQLAIKVIGQPDINSCNSPDILKQSADLRKCRFLRIFAKMYWK